MRQTLLATVALIAMVGSAYAEGKSEPTRPAASAAESSGFACDVPQAIEGKQDKFRLKDTVYTMSPRRSPNDLLCGDGKTAHWKSK